MKKQLVGAAVVLAVAATGVSYAAIPGADGVIHACATKYALRVVDAEAGDTCRNKETRLSWSQTGPRGEAGPKGEPGPQGPQGPQGPAGPAGETFGMGPGLEKVILSAPPPIGDQTQLQVKPGFRLPQACAAGAIPQRSGSGDGWQCGSASGPSSHAYKNRGSAFIENADTLIALVTVPAGSYVLLAAGDVFNDDRDRQIANCKLSTGAITTVSILAATYLPVTVLDAATFAEETTVVMTCATFSGNAAGTLIAMRVAGIN